MNFQHLYNDYVENNRSNQTQRTYSDNPTPPTTASQVTVLHAPLPRTSREESLPSTTPTVIPYAPSPPSTPEIYGPDRLFPQQRAVTYQVAEPVFPRPLVHFNERQLAMAAPPSSWTATDFKDELVRRAGASVTPGVDNTPYIQYALEAMTRPREDGRAVSELHSSGSEETNPTYRFLPNSVPGLFQPSPVYLPPTPDAHQEIMTAEAELAARRQRRATLGQPHRSVAEIARAQRPNSSGTIKLPYTPEPYREWSLSNIPRELDQIATPPPVVREQPPRDVHYWQAQPDKFRDPEKAATNPPLTFRPWILGTWSLLLLTILCTLMTLALVFCAIYSDRRNGLMAYSGTIYNGYYFVFRILPQLLAALIVLYAQNVITATFRVLPFSAMASDDLRSRRNVGFLPLYPKSFLWPQLISTWQVWIPITVTWILNITIPLQSCLFAVVYVDGIWTWSTVQGVAWVSVAVYLLMLLSTVVLTAFWHNKRTGLLPRWDMRSLADIIALVAQSNSLHQYAGTETAVRRNDMKHMLYGNTERLGYWFAPEAPENAIWYGIGLPTSEEKVDIEKYGPPIHVKDPRNLPSSRLPNHGNARYRYLPWCIRDTQVTLWVMAAAILVIALLAVSFNPATDLRHGFLPLLRAAPVQGAFSAANFLYSFLPSLLGLIIFLMFQSLDLTLRILAPWGELTRRDGSRASTSILLDYASCLPLESTWKAVKNRHWRVAFVSFLSTLLILIPVLAGGLFIALTPPSGIVRMYPNVPVLAILLTLLVLMLIGLASLIPGRNQFRLPHAVTCLSEIISFCYVDELRTDSAFEFARSHRHLKGQLGAFLDEDEESRWCFGTGQSRKGRLNIKRYGKYTGDTRKVLVAKQRAKELRDAAGQVLRDAHAISRPVPKGSSTMIGP
ncbi:hypothetical protein BJ170DRAFT_302587 [Xylariales sp. AK1849]|nr:hypothetical protein BJ170DRAFT_302587 [Xylariales sp. AK1849]